MDDTETRFSLLDLDLAPGLSPNLDPEPSRSTALVPVPPIPAPARIVPMPTDGRLVVSDEGAERASRDERMARAAGFSPEPPVYTIGTRVNSTGVENFRRSRLEYEELPSVEDAMAQLAGQIRSEDRRDIDDIQVADMRLTEHGRLVGEGLSMPLTERAFLALARQITPGGASYLRDCDPVLRAHNVNEWLERTDSLKRTLRTRMNADGEREIFAFASDRYVPFDLDRISDLVSAVAGSEMRAMVNYNGYRAKIDLLAHSDIEPENAVAGEFFKASASITAADEPGTGIRLDAQTWRNLCLNLIIVHRDRQRTGNIWHLSEDVADRVAAGLNSTLDKVGGFIAQWGAARMENVIERYGCDVEQVFKQLTAGRLVHVPGVKPERMYERLLRAWEMEPGYSKADIVNAVTRAAHECPWGSLDTTEELERQAGSLLHARVWNVEPPQLTA